MKKEKTGTADHRISEDEIIHGQEEIRDLLGSDVGTSLRLQGLFFELCENHNSLIAHLERLEKSAE